MTTRPLMVFTTRRGSLSSSPSSTLRMLKMGTSSSTGSAMVFISCSAMSPLVSIPTSFPSSSVMGMAAMCQSASMADQARLTVTARLRMGGTSYSRSWTWVRISVI